MDDNSKPMPCHFCGNEADQFYFNGEGPPPSYAVECGYCGAQGPHGLGMNRGDHAGAQRQAVKLWNDFKPSAARLDECEAALRLAHLAITNLLALFPEPPNDDSTGRIGFKENVRAAYEQATAALNAVKRLVGGDDGE